MPHARAVLLCTICTAFMCGAGAVQLAGADGLAAQDAPAAPVALIGGPGAALDASGIMAGCRTTSWSCS